MGDTYKEVCWYDKVLKEVSQLLSLRCLSDDTWEQSQDTISNTEVSHDSVDLKPHNVSPTESQDSLSIAANAMSQHTDGINSVSSSRVDAQMENPEKSFNLLGESPKRRSGDTSIENSPKRMNFGSERGEKGAMSSTSPARAECTISSENELNVMSAKSTSENNSEECHVVPTILSLSSEAVISENTLESHKSLNKRGKSNKYYDAANLDTAESDKTLPKPRQASVDSVLDSGIGDSCNSIDSTEEKFDIAELKNRRLEQHCWQPKIRESLATRLPGTNLLCSFAFFVVFAYFGIFVNDTDSNIGCDCFYREFLLPVGTRQIYFPWRGNLFRT